jgi:hypothetical protein
MIDTVKGCLEISLALARISLVGMEAIMYRYRANRRRYLSLLLIRLRSVVTKKKKTPSTSHSFFSIGSVVLGLVAGLVVIHLHNLQDARASATFLGAASRAILNKRRSGHRRT